MKKLLLIALSLIGAAAVYGQSIVISTNLASGAVVLLTTNRAAAYSIELTSTSAGVVKLFDNDDTTAPSYGTNSVTAAYPYRISYPTNMLSTYVGSNGYTNYVTNVGIFSLTLTNAAATNAMSPLFSAAVGANVAVIHTTDAIFTRGITALCSGITNGSITIYARSGQ